MKKITIYGKEYNCSDVIYNHIQELESERRILKQEVDSKTKTMFELEKINKEHKLINGQLRKELMDNIDSQDRLYERNKTLEEENKIMEKYFELISDLGYDYDGCNNVEDLKKLVDELVRFANLGRVCNITEMIYINGNKKYNILNQKLEKSDSNE